MDKDQKPNTCFDCNVEFKENDEISYFGGKLMHKQCVKRASNKANGRPCKCPKCDGTGMIKHPEAGFSSSMLGFEITSATCDICGGNGYTTKKFVAVTKIVGYVEE